MCALISAPTFDIVDVLQRPYVIIVMRLNLEKLFIRQNFILSLLIRAYQRRGVVKLHIEEPTDPHHMFNYIVKAARKAAFQKSIKYDIKIVKASKSRGVIRKVLQDGI